MEIRQSTFDSIQILLEEFSLYLRYSFYLDGEERHPESIMLRENYVTAFFLNATIRDFLVVEETSLAIDRSWSIPPKGEIGLCFRLDFPDPPPEAGPPDPARPGLPPPGPTGCGDALPGFILPGLIPPGGRKRAAGAAPRSFMLLGSRLSYPCAAFLHRRNQALLLFTDLPRRPEEQGSIGLERIQPEDGPLVRLEIHFPPREHPVTITGPKPEDEAAPIRSSFHSPGEFRHSLRLNLISAPVADIRRMGFEAVLHRSENRFPVVPVDPNPGLLQWAAPAGPGSPPAADAGRAGRFRPLDRLLADGVLRGCLGRHLTAAGGVHGVRITAGSRALSSSAGAAIALALLKLTPPAAVEDLDAGLPPPVETALRLADFCLKGQHPSGLFFETFDLKRRQWVGLRGRPNLLSMEHAASIACLLLQVAGELDRLELPGLKYRLAAHKLVDAFVEPGGSLKEIGGVIDLASLQPAEGGLGGLELIEPLILLHRADGGGPYGKALAAARKRWFSQEIDPLALPASRQGREPDAKAALLLLRAALALQAEGLTVAGLDRYPQLLYPWIYLNRDSGRDGFDPVGGILDSLRRNRLLFQGYEAAFLLWQASRLAEFELHYDAEDLVRLLTRFTAQAALGTAWYSHAPWGVRGKLRGGWPRFGPQDTRRLAREVLFLIRLKEEYPEILSAVVLPNVAAADSRPQTRR
jgi:hypothetical protein